MKIATDEEIAELMFEAVRLTIIAERTADERDFDMPNYNPKKSAAADAKKAFLDLVSTLKQGI